MAKYNGKKENKENKKYDLLLLFGCDGKVWVNLFPVILPHLLGFLTTILFLFINKKMPTDYRLPDLLLIIAPLTIVFLIIIIYNISLHKTYDLLKAIEAREKSNAGDSDAGRPTNLARILGINWQDGKLFLSLRLAMSGSCILVGFYYGQKIFSLSPYILLLILYLLAVYGQYCLTVWPYEIIMYLAFGGLTTVVSIVSFTLIDYLINGSQQHFNYDWLLPKIISFILAVIFAYITNRIYVFQSKAPILPELLSFVFWRILTSLCFEVGGLYVLVNLMHVDKQIANILAAVIVVIVNYILSKLTIFKKVRI